jgi:hypothetical protein
MWLANMPPLGDGFGFILVDYESSKTQVPEAFCSSGVEGMFPSNNGPSFRAVMRTVPSSAFIFLSSEIVGPSPFDSGGASTLIRVISVLKFANYTAFLSRFIPNVAVTRPIAPLMGSPFQWTTSRVVD